MPDIWMPSSSAASTYHTNSVTLDLVCSYLIVPAGDVERFTVDGIVTKDGTELGPFDTVVAATGYARSYAYLPADEQRELQLQQDGLWLFRSILPPRMPVNTQHTMESPFRLLEDADRVWHPWAPVIRRFLI